MALVKPAERPSTAVHRWRECLNGNSSEVRPQALSCEAVRRVDPQLLQRTASAVSRDGHQEPKDRCTKQGRPGRPAPNLHGLRLLYYETNSDSERRLSPFEVSASWSNVRANQFPRPVNLAEPSRWFVVTVNIPSRARFAIVTPASGLPPNGPCQAPAFL